MNFKMCVFFLFLYFKVKLTKDRGRRRKTLRERKLEIP